MGSFSKYIGGSPANTAIGATSGAQNGVDFRTGEDAMGRFIREELNRERVNTDYLTADPDKIRPWSCWGSKTNSTSFSSVKTVRIWPYQKPIFTKT